MRAFRPVLLFSLSLSLLIAGCSNHPTAPGSPASGAASTAIVNGTPTGAAFGSVGALLYDFDGNATIDGADLLCSGSLIAPTVFLTAGHCLEFLPPGAQVHVSFAPDLDAPGIAVIDATGFAIDPRYGRGSDPLDIGVVLLPAGSTAGIAPLALPPAGLLDTLAARGGLRGQTFVNVGYGASASRTGRPHVNFDGARQMSTSPFKSLTKLFLGLHMTEAATGQGGDCYGDSGGPKFRAGQETMVVAIVSWGDYPCRALSNSYRLDIESARSFLGGFVVLP